MAKVKMGDIKSGSENVKNVFRRPMNRRFSSWLEKQSFSNDELLEILMLCENIERHNDSREFYNRLLLSQKGIFNRGVFIYFLNHIYEKDTLVHLITKSSGLREEDKLKWITNSILSAHYWFIPNFYMNDDCKSVGIDVKNAPYNIRIAKDMVRFKKRVTNCIFPDENNEYMLEILDTMNEDELYEWYEEVVSRTYETVALEFLKTYPRTTEKMLEHYYNKSKREILAEHPNFPPKIKIKIFEETGNEKYLPEEAKNIFLF